MPPETISTATLSAMENDSPSMLRKLRTPLIVLGIMLGECVAAYLYFPSSGELVAQAEGTAAAEAQESLRIAAPEPMPELAEVDLGQFRVTTFEPISNMAVRIEFHVWGTLLTGDNEKFATMLAPKQQRFRDEVIGIVRSTELAELTDSRLTLIKQRILETTNTMLGEPMLKSIIFSDFVFNEQ